MHLQLGHQGWLARGCHHVVPLEGRTLLDHRRRPSPSHLRRPPRPTCLCRRQRRRRGPGYAGPFGAATAKGRCIIHEDRETKDWFYPEFAAKLNPTNPEAAAGFVQTLDSPLRVVLEIVPEKWILFDGAKFGADAAGTLSDDQKGPMLSADAERMPKELERRGIS